MRNGQMLLENMFMMGLILVLVVGIFYYSTSFTVSNYRQRQTEEAVHNLLITAQAVHELGPGNKDSALVSLPENVDLKVASKQLIAQNADGTINVSMNTPFDVIGYVPPLTGMGTIVVKAINNSLVKIGHWFYLTGVQPSAVNFTQMPPEAYLYGEDLPSSGYLLVNGLPYDKTQFVYINSTLIWFKPSPSVFQSPPNQQVTYYLSLNDTVTNDVSNSLPFVVIGP